MSSVIGRIFSVMTFGESHGPCVGAVVDGCPANLALSEVDIQAQLDRRRPGQTDMATSRSEKDQVRILSGVENGETLGAPILMIVDNSDTHPADYEQLRNMPRPSHADYTYRLKYGISAASGGGRSSARETVGRVAAGAVAEKYLGEEHDIEIVAWVSSVGCIDASPGLVEGDISRADVDSTPVRCPDSAVAEKMHAAVTEAHEAGDSLGGIVTCVCRNVPAGLGEPVFDKMEAILASAMMSIPAVKGFEVGSGFAGTRMKGSEHNDVFVKKAGGLGTATNRSGGIQGGITNGEPVVMRVAFKPTASISAAQQTVDFDGNPGVLALKGRHDACVLPRAVPVVEAMAAIVLADMSLIAGCEG